MERQSDGERRSAAFPLARRGDSSEVQLNDPVGDGETEPESLRAALLADPLPVALEEMWQFFRRDSLPRVADEQFHVFAAARIAKLDPAPGRGKADRVRKQVPDDLLQPFRITVDGAGTGFQRGLDSEVLGKGGGPE